MSHYSKMDFWHVQFKESLPMMLAIWYVRRNRNFDEIYHHALDMNPVHVAEYTKGKYGKCELGAYLVRHHGYVQAILKEIRVPGLAGMLNESIQVVNPKIQVDLCQDIRKKDPTHPVLKGEAWSVELAEELAAVIGEQIVMLWSDALASKMVEIRKEALKFKTVSKVMDA